MLGFWGAALFGSIFFLLRVILFIAGAGGDSGGEDGGDAGVAEAGNGAFRLLSLNSLTGFTAMFGWGGLAAREQFGLGLPLSLLVGAGAGFAAMLSTALIFHAAMKLRSDGARFSMQDAVGCEAEVYLRIPAQGKGRVSFVVNGVKRQADAVSDTADLIPSFEKTLITRVIDSHTVAVIRFER
ncbi:MAG: hypothetical protein LBF87_08395 [Treponema sp.]|jgi:hypothetical protein|nr:hypothetical protein [Treponema sp.]